MKFTIKTALIGMGLASLLVAALFSGSPLFLNLVTSGFLLLVPMMLVFAICDGRKSRRPFWIGSFIMSVTCVCGSFAFNIFSPIEYEIANLVCMVGSPSLAEFDPSMSPFAAPALPAPNVLPVSTAFQPIAPVYPTFPPAGTPVASYRIYPNSSYNEHYQSVVAFVPVLLSVLAGVCGGLAALWISKTPTTDTQPGQSEIAELPENSN